MRRLLIFILVSCICFSHVSALADNASSAILINGDTKEILFEKQAYDKKFPASTTKIMTLILIFEALNNNELKLSDSITASSYASSMGGSQIYLKEGETMIVEDLLKSIILASANDACVVFAEYLCGSVDEFVSKMNRKAKTLKLKNTNFTNCTGLHDDNHYSCAYDLGIMASYLLEIGNDKLLQYTTLKEEYIRNGDFWLVNTNKLLASDLSITGLKTGYTKEAKYCLVSTASKNNQTMIAVVLDEPKAKIRNEEAKALLNYGFNLYQPHTLFQKGEIIETIDLPYMKEKKVDLICKEDIVIPLRKENNEVPKYSIEYLNTTSFKKDDCIARIVCEGLSFDLYASNNATPLNLVERVYEIFLNFCKGR